MNCGTERGWRTHKTSNERPCKWCLLWKEKHDAAKDAPTTRAAVERVVKVRRKPRPKPTKTKQPPKPRVLKPCGTPAAYKRHLLHQEEPCDPCRKSESAERQKRKVARRAVVGKVAA